MASLAGRTVLITGACGDVGRACVEVARAAGGRVMMSDLSPPPPGLLGPEVAYFQADVTRPAAMTAAVEASVARFGGLDAAILAAGVEGPVAPIEEITEAALDQVLAVNLKGSLFALQACLNHMKPQGRGDIVALSSISGVVGSATLGAYTLSKHAVIGLVRAAALEAGPHGIRINAVCPGPIQSAMMQRLDRVLAERDPQRFSGRADAAKSLPTQRYVTAAEVAEMAAFLLSDAAASCHGGTYMVDGGFTAR